MKLEQNSSSRHQYLHSTNFLHARAHCCCWAKTDPHYREEGIMVPTPGTRHLLPLNTKFKNTTVSLKIFHHFLQHSSFLLHWLNIQFWVMCSRTMILDVLCVLMQALCFIGTLSILWVVASFIFCWWHTFDIFIFSFSPKCLPSLWNNLNSFLLFWCLLKIILGNLSNFIKEAI